MLNLTMGSKISVNILSLFKYDSNNLFYKQISIIYLFIFEKLINLINNINNIKNI